MQPPAAHVHAGALDDLPPLGFLHHCIWNLEP